MAPTAEGYSLKKALTATWGKPKYDKLGDSRYPHLPERFSEVTWVQGNVRAALQYPEAGKDPTTLSIVDMKGTP